jgi:N-acetyl-anhydromuramyl-L-alanine amidase AmpD
LAERASGREATSEFEAQLPSITWFQTQLARVGYDTPQTGELDVATRHVLTAFQMHFRPSRFDGTRTHKRQPSFRCLIRQNNDARPAVNALSQSAAITHW